MKPRGGNVMQPELVRLRTHSDIVLLRVLCNQAADPFLLMSPGNVLPVHYFNATNLLYRFKEKVRADHLRTFLFVNDW